MHSASAMDPSASAMDLSASLRCKHRLPGQFPSIRWPNWTKILAAEWILVPKVGYAGQVWIKTKFLKINKEKIRGCLSPVSSNICDFISKYKYFTFYKDVTSVTCESKLKLRNSICVIKAIYCCIWMLFFLSNHFSPSPENAEAIHFQS